MPEDCSVLPERAKIQRRIPADVDRRCVFVERRSVRGGDRRVPRKSESVREGFARGREQLAAAQSDLAGSQSCAVAKGERAARERNAADRIRLVERHEAGVDGERAHHGRRPPAFSKSAASDASKVRLLARSALLIIDNIGAEYRNGDGVAQARDGVRRPVRGLIASIAVGSILPGDGGHESLPPSRLRFSKLDQQEPELRQQRQV